MKNTKITEAELKEAFETLGEKYSDDVVEAYFNLGLNNTNDDANDTAEHIAEIYRGEYEDDETFVRELLYTTEPEFNNLPTYISIDWERTARDIMYDYSEEDGHYFRNI